MQDGSGESESKEEKWHAAGMTIFGCIMVWHNDKQWLNMRKKDV